MTAQLALDFDPAPPSGVPWYDWHDREGRAVVGELVAWEPDYCDEMPCRWGWVEVRIRWREDVGAVDYTERYSTRERWPRFAARGW